MKILGERKFRRINDLMEDPQFPYQVGRLVGAAEMTSHWLSIQEAPPEAQEIGRRLGGIVDYFFEGDSARPRKPDDAN